MSEKINRNSKSQMLGSVKNDSKVLKRTGLNCLSVILSSIVIASCGSGKLMTKTVAYQSVRTMHAQPTETSPVPDEAKIAVVYSFDVNGGLTVIVYNKTSEIMTIDQTKSFFINSSGKSTSYYDPTVHAISTTNSTSSTSGVSVNLGAIAGILGIGGPLGLLAGGINVGGAETSSTATTETTYFSDQPRVSLGPYGSGVMSKVFVEPMIGKSLLSNETPKNMVSLLPDDTYCKFKVCISYSLDGEQTFDTIVTDFYANSWVVVPVQSHGHVNDALRTVFFSKPDALNEYLYILYFNSQLGSSMEQGYLYDYK